MGSFKAVNYYIDTYYINLSQFILISEYPPNNSVDRINWAVQVYSRPERHREPRLSLPAFKVETGRLGG